MKLINSNIFILKTDQDFTFVHITSFQELAFLFVYNHMVSGSRFELDIWSGVGVIKPIFSVPLFSQFFTMIETTVSCMIARSYLTGVTAAKPRRHLTDMNAIESI